MKNKLLSMAFAAALCVSLLAGCGASNEGSLFPDPVQEGDKPASEPVQENDASSAVKNNGSEFVKVGDTVYFRQYDDDTLRLSSTSDDFPAGEYASGDGMMMAVKDGETTAKEVFSDNGYGDFFYYDGRFYGMRKQPVDEDLPKDEWEYCYEDDLKTVTYSVKPDGSDDKVIGDGDLKMLSSDGSCFLMSSSFTDINGEYIEEYTVIKDQKTVLKLSSADVNDFCSFAGATDTRVIYALADERDDTVLNIFSHAFADGESTSGDILIGTIEGGEDAFGVPLLYEFRNDGEKIYISAGIYFGTASDVQKTFFAYGNAAEKDSLQVSTEESEYDEMSTVPPYWKFIVEDGKMVHVDGLPGEVEYRFLFGDSASGDDSRRVLSYYDDKGKRVNTTVEPFDRERVELEQYSDFRFNMPYGACIDGIMYFALNTDVHTPADDIGWRFCYHTAHTYYGMAKPNDSEMTVLGDVSYDRPRQFIAYIIDNEVPAIEHVVLQDYTIEELDEGGYEIEPAPMVSSYELSDDFSFIIPDYSYTEYEGGFPPAGEGSGGAAEFYEYMSLRGRPIDGDALSLEGTAFEEPFTTGEEMYSEENDTGWERVHVWFNGLGQIEKIIPDYAG